MGCKHCLFFNDSESEGLYVFKQTQGGTVAPRLSAREINIGSYRRSLRKRDNTVVYIFVQSIICAKV